MLNPGKNTSLVGMILLLTCIWVSTSAYADDQNWTSNSVKWNSSPDVSWSISSEMKYRSWDYSDGLYLKNWVIGTSRKLDNGWVLGLAYKQELTRRLEGTDVLERRPYLNFSHKKTFNNRSAFDFRIRLEVRRFDGAMKADHYRLRFKFRLTAKRSILGHTVEPYLAIEPFYDTASDSFSKYRFYMGTMVPIFRHTKIRLGYILEDSRTGSPHHVFQTGLSLKF